MQNERLRPYFLLLLLVGAGALTALIFAPFLKALALAAVFAVVLQGLYGSISGWLRGRAGLAALATVLVGVIVILLPLSLVGTLVAREARDLYVSLDQGSAQAILTQAFSRADLALGGLGLGAFSREFSVDVGDYAKQGLAWIAEHAGAIFGGITAFLLSFFIFFVALYYLLRDGPVVRRALIELSPLSDHEDEQVFARLARAVNSVIKGNLMIAFIQGALSMLGFILFGVPHAILWGTVTAVAALIPGLGTALVFAPVIAFLFFTGSTFAAVGLLIWGALAVGLVDNLLGPKLIGRGMQLHPLLVLLAVLGGLILFGPAGIFLGPLSLSLLFALLSIYAESSKRAA